ncbi:MAG: MBL fold metallo-hydrolase [Planctomycetota bacterium]|nr:MBL fold metallo-hydrolase [Planctomycetota bacterium]
MFAILSIIVLLIGAGPVQGSATEPDPFIVVLGIAQDAGYPQAGCKRECCAAAWGDPARRRHISCLAIVDPHTHQRWLIDATPDIRAQLRMLDAVEPPTGTPGLAGILLTHGHIGHYTGLMFLGHESIGAKGVSVYTMPRMRGFLTGNGPWDQLVRYGNIKLQPLTADTPVRLNERITVTPLRVPHREEYTEVVGFRIAGPNRSVLFIPDIDKWDRWHRRIEDLIAAVDVAYLDGTFYADGEIPSRDMSQIPHPFISESMKRFATLPAEERAKIRFIHLNHTNPALDPDSAAARAIHSAGFAVANELERTPL